METSFALTGKGYVLIASDMTIARSIVKMKGDEDKMKILNSRLVMTYSGEPGDTTAFAEYVERNIRLYTMRHDHELRPESAAAWIRTSLAESLRSRNAYAVNILLAGFDKTITAREKDKHNVGGIPKLYWIDYLGTKAEVPFAAHGYGSYFTLGLLDRYHNPEADLDEGLAALRRCIEEAEKRLIIGGGSKYKVRVVDKDGVRELEL